MMGDRTLNELKGPDMHVEIRSLNPGSKCV